MKHIITLILCALLLISISRSQDLQPKGIMQVSLSADFGAYFQALEEQDFDLALEFVFPALFDLIPEDFMLENLENDASDGENDFRIIEATISPVTNFAEDDGHHYAMVSYAYTLEIKQGDGAGWDTLDDDEEEEDWESETLDVDDYRRKYGVKNVQYDAAKKIIKIKRIGRLIAIQSKDEFEDDGWKFIELKDEMIPMIEQLIPAVILTKLKS